MIRDTIRKLEDRIRAAGGATEETRRDLLGLLAELRGELEGLEDTHAADARTIAGRTLEAANGETFEESEGRLHDLEASVREFEETHPRLLAVVRSLLRTLADAGI
jgi:hypothetical protein